MELNNANFVQFCTFFFRNFYRGWAIGSLKFSTFFFILLFSNILMKITFLAKFKWKKVLLKTNNVVFAKENDKLLNINQMRFIFLAWVCRMALFNSVLYGNICSFAIFNSVLCNFFYRSIALFNSALLTFAFLFFC